jgi:predicted alpha/beta-fold hydrolase
MFSSVDVGESMTRSPDHRITGSPDLFSPSWWLPGAHLQTIWGRLARPRRLVALRREVLAAPDGDEIVLDHVDGPAGSPRLLLLHGLEGSSYSVYVQGMFLVASARGWRGTAINFRSCARDPKDLDRMLENRRPRLYHSGETTDLDFVVKTLAGREPETPLVAAGVSLGGNVLVKWLGENSARLPVRAAAAVSVPFDLGEGASHLETPLGRVYVRSFLRTLRPKAFSVARRFPDAAARLDLEAVRRARTFFEFDDAATAPLHGFAGAADYYAKSSSVGFVSRITTPTLCLSAEDDPFLPASVLDRVAERASPSVELLRTRRGGHIGFVSGRVPWSPRYWAEELVVEWLSRKLGEVSPEL